VRKDTRWDAGERGPVGDVVADAQCSMVADVAGAVEEVDPVGYGEDDAAQYNGCLAL